MTSSTPRASTLILVDLPHKTFVGFDLVSFDSSPDFKGISNLPSGLHFVYTGADATLAIRTGHWLHLDAVSSPTQIFRWNHESESLEQFDGSNDASQAIVRNIPTLRNRGLVDYNALLDANEKLQAKEANPTTTSEASKLELWQALSRHISTKTLQRILSPTFLDHSVWTLSSISSAPNDSESIPGLSQDESEKILHDNGSTALNFVSIDLKQTWPDGSIGRDRTDKARDRSWYLGRLFDLLASNTEDQENGKKAEEGAKEKGGMDRKVGARNLMGEFQFCFLMVLTMANYSCLEQWKRILGVVFTCRTALAEAEGFFVEFVKTFRMQLERVEDVEGGLFEMGDDIGSAWLRRLLKTFRANVDELMNRERAAELHAELSKLEDWLRETWGWENDGDVLRRGMVELEDGERIEMQMDGLDEEEETGEYAPVVVDT